MAAAKWLGGYYRRLLLPIRPWRQRRLREQVSGMREPNIVLGAGRQSYNGWVATDISVLDITSPSDWSALFCPGGIKRLLAEHVMEHLTLEENELALKLCYQYLAPGGVLRIAVPDGYRQDPHYLDRVAPPKDGHKVLFNVDTLSQLVEKYGFGAKALEFFDERCEFNEIPWRDEDGRVERSHRHDHRLTFSFRGVFYTSLIVDACKDLGGNHAASK